MQDGYAQQSRQFLTQAGEELNKGDLVQASEKLCGASAQMVKAVAQRRGWRHTSHRNLYEAVDRLTQETGDRSLRTLFQVAQALHFNFYENVQIRGFVEDGLSQVEEFVSKLERL